MYKTTFNLVVLSREPLPELELSELARRCEEGAYVADGCREAAVNLSGKEMANALHAAGSDSFFFGLDAEGNTVEE